MSRFFEILRVAIGAIWAYRLRSSLTLVGVVIGVATIVTVVSVISGLNRYVREEIFSLSPDVFIVSKFGIIQGRDEFLRAMRRRNMTLQEMARIRDLCTSCRDVGAAVQGTKALRSGDRRLPDVQITGSTANLADLYSIDVIEGRFYIDAEVRRASPVAVIGWDVRDQLFPGIDPIGRSLSVEGYPLKVIGLLRRQGSILGQSQDNIIWIPIKTYDKLFGRNRSIDIWVQAESLALLGEAQDEVRMLLRRMRGLPLQAEDPFGMVTAEALQVLWAGISAAAFAMMALIASISLVVGGIVIMNIMLVSVAERTQEIGVREAVGARRRDILLQFLMEAGMLSLAGGLLGVAIGAGVPVYVGFLYDFDVPVSAASVVVAFGVSMAVGVFFGLYPARKAANMNIVDSLSYE